MMTDLSEIVSTLSTDVTGNERKEVYSKFNENVKDEFDATKQSDAKDLNCLITIATRDVTINSCTDVVSEALQTLIICVNFDNLVKLLDVEEASRVIGCLCSCVCKTEDKGCCQRALFCIATQKLPDSLVQLKVEEILFALEHAMEKWRGQSMTVENECVNVIDRLVTQVNKEMCEMSTRWGQLLVPVVTHKAIKVRENAHDVLKTALNSAQTHQKQLAALLKQPLKQTVLPGLKKLFNENHQIYVLNCWGTLVQLIGKELHSSSHINDFLPIVELGFKSMQPEVKISAFQAWQHLINNFAINPAVLQDPKRIKLIMQVFKHNNAKSEPVAVAKMKVWWHFIWLLGNKVTPNYDMVAAPLLQFCLGGKSVNRPPGSTPQMNGASPITPHLKLTGPSSTQYPVFKSLQLLGCDALAHFLGSCEDQLIEHDFQIDALRHDVVSGPSFFIKQSSHFITMATEFFCNLGNSVPESLVIHIWQWLIAHLKNAIDSPVKLDIRDTLNTLLTQFQIIVLSKNLDSSLILKMFRGVCSLPKKVLCSTAYSIGGGEMVNGTPALFTLNLLLTPNLLQSSSNIEPYNDMFASLITCGTSHSTCTLGFLQSVLEIVARNAEFVENKETLWRLWSAIVSSLLEHIAKTNEVNQGDSLEHNFDCCVQALSFPAIHTLSAMPQPSVKTMLKTWSELYKTVNRLAALVTSAESNIVCEEVASNILEAVKKQTAVEAGDVDLLVQMGHVMVTSLDFSAFTNQSTFNLASSPKKWVKKKGRPLENIHSVVSLLGHLQTQALLFTADKELFKKPTNVGLQSIFNVLVDSFCTLFTHVTSSNVISNLIGHLAHPIGDLLSDACKKSSKVFNNAFQQKLETLWADICTSIQSRYTAMFDSTFLHQLSPLLEATFLHSRRQIKNQTLALWSSTFSKVSSLDYPESLKPVLSKVKVKSSIQLPGFVVMDTAVIEETPVSQMSQTQAPEPRIPGMPSPHKIRGSFLNKPVSPRLSRSPLRSPSSPVKPNSAKKKVLNLDGFKDDEFVVIKYSPKKKMVLTDHQREMMKEKRSLPAMYNSLENSVDASLMAAHFSTDTQMDGSLSETPTPTSTQPFSLFGSVIPPTNQADKQEEDSKQKKTRGRGKVKSPKTSQTSDPPKDTSKKSDKRSPKTHPPEVRRSVRFKGQSSPEAQTEEGTKRKDKTGKMESEIDTDSVVVIEDSEPMDVDDIELPDLNTEYSGKNCSTKEKEKSGVTLESQIDLTKDSENVETQKDTEHETVTDDSNAEKGNSEEKLTIDGSDKSSYMESVPQNVLGVMGLTLSSSSKSTDPKSGDSNESFGLRSSSGKANSEDKVPGSQNNYKANVIDKLNQSEKTVNCENETEKASSEPLFSWTQKLNELNQSPKPSSPVKKFSSQDSSRSPLRRGRSPLKSPKRNTKKLANENEEGALDKWIIRSPVKGVVFPDKPEELVVANVSQSLVEETQSPSKFLKAKGSQSDGMSPSIMETPPKNVLENIPVNHGNSNRKLFSSQGSNPDLDIVEDSNLIPASPNSKSISLKTGTPVLKIKKLTDTEILRYSPSRKNSQYQSLTPTRREATTESVKKVKCALVNGIDVQDESSHEHDDFSVFKPLDSEKLSSEKHKQEDDFFSKSLSATDQAMLEMTEQSVAKDTESANVKIPEDVPVESEDPFLGSQALFSQDIPVDEGKKKLSDTEMAHSVESTQPSSEDMLSTQNSTEDGLSGTSEKSETSQESNNSVTIETSTPGRGRKRKQVTPKKLTPEDSKKKKKNESTESKGSARKASSRIRDQKGKKKESLGEESSQEKEESCVKETQDKSRESETENKPGKKIGRKTKAKSVSPKTSAAKESPSEMVDKVDTEIEMVEPVLNIEREIRRSMSEHEEMEVEEVIDSQVEIKEMPERKKGRKNLRLTKIKGGEELKKGNQDGESNDENSEGPSKKLEADTTSAHVKKASKKKQNVDVVENTEDASPPTKRVTPKQKSVAKGTVKNKKEVAQKEVMINDGDSNLDMEESKEMNEQAVETKTNKIESEATTLESTEPDKSETKAKQKRGRKPKQKDNQSIDADADKKDDAVKTTGSTDSDDDVPLLQMSRQCKKIVKNGKSEQEKETVTSSVASKLRSNSLKKTRMRSGEKKSSTSPQAKKAVSLALKRTRTSETKRKLIKNDDKTADPEKDDNTNIAENKKVDEGQDEVNKPVEDESKTNGSVQSKGILSWKKKEDLDETPRKGIETSKTSVASVIMMRNSDSKLILGSRKFQKRGGVARRSILKTGSVGSTDDSGSPIRVTDFHPITVNRIYSPTASPSASILKKRRLSEDPGSDTNSPPAKQRRVSFATPLIDADNSLLPGNTTERPSSPLVTHSNESQTNTGPNKIPSTPTSAIIPSSDVTNLIPSRLLDTQSTQGSPSQRNYESTQESQLDSAEPVCPELTGCEQSVEKVLPQLTSSIWSRGLVQLVRARNIHTIGDLSALSEVDIHSLPIRSPKVDTVRKVLTKFGQNLQTSKAKLWGSPKVRLDSKNDQINNAAKQSTSVAVRTGQIEQDNTGGECSEEIESILVGSGDLIDEVNRLTKPMDQSESCKKSHDGANDQSGSSEKTVGQSEASVSNLNSTTDMKNMLKNFVDSFAKNDILKEVKNLKSNDLVEVNQMLTDVQNKIVTELRNRCSTSPT